MAGTGIRARALAGFNVVAVKAVNVVQISLVLSKMAKLRIVSSAQLKKEVPGGVSEVGRGQLVSPAGKRFAKSGTNPSPRCMTLTPSVVTAQ